MKGLINVSEKTRVRLKIVGSEFVVSADEDKDYIVKISRMVDQQIKSFLNQGESMNIAIAAILAALNYCDELEKEKIITDELLRRTEASESLASRVSAEIESLRHENQQLKEEKLGLHKIIEELHGMAETKDKQLPISEMKAPQQQSIPLAADEAEKQPEDKAESLNEEETKTETEIVKDTQVVKPEQSKVQQSKEPEIETEKEPVKELQKEEPEQVNQEQTKTETASNAAPVQNEAPTPKAPPLTARQMLEEKRRALLAQQKANPKQNNRPKPFRPVSSEKSGGGSFSHGNAKPSGRTDTKAAENPSGEEMINFFGRR